MIPGNRPQDQDWEDLWAWIGKIDIDAHDLLLLVVDWCRQNDIEEHWKISHGRDSEEESQSIQGHEGSLGETEEEGS